MFDFIKNVLFILRYGKAFEAEPTFHSGINSVVLLTAAGHEFETSIELRKIGANLLILKTVLRNFRMFFFFFFNEHIL